MAERKKGNEVHEKSRGRKETWRERHVGIAEVTFAALKYVCWRKHKWQNTVYTVHTSASLKTTSVWLLFAPEPTPI